MPKRNVSTYDFHEVFLELESVARGIAYGDVDPVPQYPELHRVLAKLDKLRDTVEIERKQ